MKFSTRKVMNFTIGKCIKRKLFLSELEKWSTILGTFNKYSKFVIKHFKVHLTWWQQNQFSLGNGDQFLCHLCQQIFVFCYRKYLKYFQEIHKKIRTIEISQNLLKHIMLISWVCTYSQKKLFTPQFYVLYFP